MGNEDRNRCETACRKLTEAIAELDACGLAIAATHAHHCLELVRQALQKSQDDPAALSS